MSSIQYHVALPSNHNDYTEVFTSLPAAINAAKRGYGDVKAVLPIVVSNQLQDVSSDLHQLLKDIECH